MELNKSNLKKIRGIIVFTAIVIACFWKYDVVFAILKFAFGILFPFILGGAIAFILNVPMNFIERHLFPEKKKEKSKIIRKIARPVSLILVFLFVIGIISLIIFVLAPQLGKTFANLGASIQEFIPKVKMFAEDIFHNNRDVMAWIDGLEFDWNKIMQVGMDFFKTGAGNMLDSTLVMAKNIVNGIATFFIALAFSCYILLQKEKLNIQAKKVLFAFVPKGKAEATLEVLTLTYNTFSNFLTGQCVEAIILGSMFVVTMTILRIPYALLIGIVISFTALIPVFGAFIGCVIGAFLIFIVDPFKAMIFVILFLVLQQIEGNFIYPHVVGNSVGLPSIWVLAAVSIGGKLMGVVGMLVFIPFVSVLYALFREVVYIKLRQQHINPKDIK
ncbi:AI-2E family transporter [Dorea acetigenes]|uniref:AI-2E family transporter n=1 Tax=Dorea acetigenes TaxID=2981787 RepID=A0ABT2RPK4_9FIRM|nr:AI-2E family transporter [Dorea acetigenes]MCU6687345.1 AI-2E family transporter [Dorea acetigenes]SCJ37367.1 pheromone autoinducer 2 transporter [uncultured Clostridium sp.]